MVYFSATGNTKEAAEFIASTADVDLFELVPVSPYSDSDLDWTDISSRVVREHDNEDERYTPLVSESVDNWEEYDTVFIGYPIWWGLAAWPVNSFVEANNFTDKTVIPFCTSSSSGLGESAELLGQSAGTGTWLEGKNFSSGVTQQETAQWVDELNI